MLYVVVGVCTFGCLMLLSLIAPQLFNRDMRRSSRVFWFGVAGVAVPVLSLIVINVLAVALV